jgi:hypothetical protein
MLFAGFMLKESNLSDTLLMFKMIKKINGKFRVIAKSGRNMGEYDSKKKAETRLKQIEMFKHMKRR